MFDKFEIVKADSRTPITLKDGEEVMVKLTLIVPEEDYKESLKIIIQE
jgi:predicted DNA-binding antitoxin AbrB/MazE fold protein